MTGLLPSKIEVWHCSNVALEIANSPSWQWPEIIRRERADAARAGAPASPPQDAPIPILLWCPLCNWRHVDDGAFATRLHHTHSCQKCGHTWRPAIAATVGVQFLPGFKDDAPP